MESINHLYIIVDQILIYPPRWYSVNGIIGSSVNNNLFKLIMKKKKGSFIRITVETEKIERKYKKFPLL
jgi:hypothetical protein